MVSVAVDETGSTQKCQRSITLPGIVDTAVSATTEVPDPDGRSGAIAVIYCYPSIPLEPAGRAQAVRYICKQVYFAIHYIIY